MMNIQQKHHCYHSKPPLWHGLQLYSSNRFLGSFND